MSAIHCSLVAGLLNLHVEVTLTAWYIHSPTQPDNTQYQSLAINCCLELYSVPTWVNYHWNCNCPRDVKESQLELGILNSFAELTWLVCEHATWLVIQWRLKITIRKKANISCYDKLFFRINKIIEKLLPWSELQLPDVVMSCHPQPKLSLRLMIELNCLATGPLGALICKQVGIGLMPCWYNGLLFVSE